MIASHGRPRGMRVPPARLGAAGRPPLIALDVNASVGMV